MDQTTHEVRLANWKSIIEQCNARPEGMSAKQWLSDHDIPEKQYYYWQRKIRSMTFSELSSSLQEVSAPQKPSVQMPKVSFAEFSAESIYTEPVPAIMIKTGKSTIEISSAVSEALMVKLLKVVAHAL